MGITSVKSQPAPNWVNNINPQKNSGEISWDKNKSTKKLVKNDSNNVNKKIEDKIKLDLDEKNMIQKLRQRDREVRQHETAHKTAGGQYVGSISYTYQEGPKGRQYAVGGSAQIDTSPVHGEPEKTIEKAKVVKRAALAPAKPSSKDLQVASKAEQMKQEAQVQEKNDQKTNKKEKITNKYKNNISVNIELYA